MFVLTYMFNMNSDQVSFNDKFLKTRLIIIINIILPLSNNNPNYTRTRHAPIDSSISSLSPFSPFHFFPPSIHSLHSLDFLTREVRLSTGEYTYGCDHQKTKFILERRVSDCGLPQLLTHTLIFPIHRPTVLFV